MLGLSDVTIGGSVDVMICATIRAKLPASLEGYSPEGCLSLDVMIPLIGAALRASVVMNSSCSSMAI
jgi:hypothetical protein